MLWDSNKMDELCKNPPDTTQTEYAYPGVKQQQKDQNSILNYHKQVNYLRNKYPEIARGTVAFNSDLFEKTYGESTVCIVISFDKEADQTVEGIEYTNCEFVSASGGKAELKNGALTISPQTIAILSGKGE